MNKVKVTLEQWQTFLAVVEFGSFAKAGEALHKSQSTVSYAMQQLQQRLGVELLNIEGRRATLTTIGKDYLPRAQQLTQLATDIESSLKIIRSGCEDRLRIAVDGIFPKRILLKSLALFEKAKLPTQIELQEEILSGSLERLNEDSCDIAISSLAPHDMLSQKLLDIKSIPCAHIDSHLHKLDRFVTEEDLRNSLNIVVKDSARKTERSEGWLGAHLKWKVDSLHLKASLLSKNIGYSWLAKHIIDDLHLPLKELNFEEDRSRSYPQYLIYKNTAKLGPAAKRFIEIISEVSQEFHND